MFENYDWKKFDVDFNSYFNGDKRYTAKDYANLYDYVWNKCTENPEYTIDCYNQRYTVRTKDEVEKIREANQTEYEKKEKEYQNKFKLLLDEKIVLHKKLEDLDYIGIKISMGRATKEEYSKEIELSKKYADRINEINEEIKKIKVEYNKE